MSNHDTAVLSTCRNALVAGSTVKLYIACHRRDEDSDDSGTVRINRRTDTAALDHRIHHTRSGRCRNHKLVIVEWVNVLNEPRLNARLEINRAQLGFERGRSRVRIE